MMKKRRVNKKTGHMRLYVAAGLMVLLVVLALLAPYLIVNDPYATNAEWVKSGPSALFPWGTDKLGRCIYSRVLMGARMSIFASLLVVGVSMVVGTLFGMVSGYLGGLADSIIMRLTDMILAFPQMVLAIAVAGILGGSLVNAMLALGITGWTLYARLVRSRVLSMKEEEFIYAARLGGNRSLRIMLVHMLPNLAGEIWVNASIQIGTTMMGFAGLSYLGLGVQAPEAEWGSMMNEARGYMQQAPWAVLAPGLALLAAVIICNLFGDAMGELHNRKGQANE